MQTLPVAHVLGDVVDAARDGGVVLVAPPGTGKTTLVPLALADALAGRIIVAEPRRIAARAAARRMADLRGERVGESVGYSVRGDRNVGPRTRVEVVTTGLLVQRLLADPDLPGVAAVMLDECHERHLDTDLALAFLVEARAEVRPDLRLLATSATADAERFATLLDAPVIRAEGALHPVRVVWCPPPRPTAAPHGLRVDPALLDHVAATVRRAWQETEGDLLVFLPGAGEIGSVQRRLAGLPIVVLHGRLPAGQQDAALTPGDRRVVLSTAVAESSLTVPGVRVVVDAGLARVPRTDHARGLGSLVTVRAARASTVQRAGRAGREGPGVVYRCWSERDDERLPAQPEPEVAVAELTGFALALAGWGHPDGTGLALPDAPPEAAMRVARATLQALGAVDADGRITARGRRIARVGAHPRLARALLDGAPLVGARRAAEVVAMLADDTVVSGDDLAAAWRRLRTGRDPAASRWRAEAGRLEATAREEGIDQRRTGDGQPDAVPSDDLAAGLIAGLAYPERLARARRADTHAYLMAGGTEATLPAGSALAGHPWLAIAVADRQPGSATARIRVAAAIDEDTAREVGAALLSTVDEVTWTAAKRVDRLGAIVLAERDLADPPRALVEAALRDGLRREGVHLLRWSRDATQLRERMAFCHKVLGPPWPDVSDEALVERLNLAAVRRKADLSGVDAAAALRAMLPWPAAERFDRLAPERLPVPSGSQVRLDYGDPAAPVLAVKVQEAFGWAATPTVGDGRVPVLLHLLSPAGRPVAVTRDLASFWRTGYPQVRAELRGRYPRHPWPEDPTTATPTRRTNPRR